MKDITESNKMIAEFMGHIFNGVEYILPEYERIIPFNTQSKKATCLECFKSSIFKPSELQYHTSWDWLIPVVEKIESLIFEDDEYYNFQILGGCCVYIISSHGNEIVSVDNVSSKIDCAYKAVVEFIKWYNQCNTK